MDAYTVVRPLGKGSFGLALLVHRRSDGAELVVKTVDMNAMNDDQRRRAISEVAILRSLRHSHVIGCDGAFQENDVLHIVLEYAGGGDLSGRIAAAQSPGAAPFAVPLRLASLCTLIPRVTTAGERWEWSRGRFLGTSN